MTEAHRLDAKQAFAEAQLGADLGSVQYELNEKLVSRHRASTHQSPYPAQGGKELAPVSILASDGIRLTEARYDISQSVHAGQRLEIVNVPFVGSRVTVRGRLVGKFEKGGRQFVVVETTSEDDAGRLLARGRMVGVARYRPEAG